MGRNRTQDRRLALSTGLRKGGAEVLLVAHRRSKGAARKSPGEGLDTLLHPGTQLSCRSRDQ
jgi:hypothetical protein